MTQQRNGICRRLRQIRVDLNAEGGGPLLDEALHVPFRTWANDESGITVPSPVLLRFIALTEACLSRLLTGGPPRYSQIGEGPCRHPFAPSH